MWPERRLIAAGASRGASGKDCAALFSTQVEAGQQWLARAGHNGMALPATPLQNPFPYAPGLPPPPPGCPLPARTPAAAPPTKRATSNPYVAFCREQRPFLPADLRNAEREQTLGMRMECVDMESHRVPEPLVPVSCIPRVLGARYSFPRAAGSPHCTSAIRVIGTGGGSAKPLSKTVCLPLK